MWGHEPLDLEFASILIRTHVRLSISYFFVLLPLLVLDLSPLSFVLFSPSFLFRLRLSRCFSIGSLLASGELAPVGSTAFTTPEARKAGAANDGLFPIPAMWRPPWEGHQPPGAPTSPMLHKRVARNAARHDVRLPPAHDARA